MRVSRNSTLAFAAMVALVLMVASNSNNHRPLFADSWTARDASANPVKLTLAALESADAVEQAPWSILGPETADAGGPALPMVAAATVILADTFSRPNNPVVGPAGGPGWTEIEQVGSTASIAASKLFFDDTSDGVNRPLVRRSFSPVSTGTLEWDFDVDWTRTGAEATYRFLMQLGDGAVMTDGSQNGGAGVNLVWANVGGAHQSLAYSKGGVNTALAVVSGPAHISVVADLATKTYSVAVNGGVVGASLPFDGPVSSLGLVRYITDNLDERNFSGRTVDNLVIGITAAPPAGTFFSDNFNRVNSPVVGESWVEVEQSGATASIAANKLYFEGTSNSNARPVVSRTFTPVSAGILHWVFDFNWTKTGVDSDSELWMQLGDSTRMMDTTVNKNLGVGVDLRWGANGMFPQRLVARQNGGGVGVQPLVDLLSGPKQVAVTVNLATRTYTVAIGGTQVGTGLAFDDSANVTTLDTVRFLTNNMLASSFSDRTFDNVTISRE